MKHFNSFFKVKKLTRRSFFNYNYKYLIADDNALLVLLLL